MTEGDFLKDIIVSTIQDMRSVYRERLLDKFEDWQPVADHPHEFNARCPSCKSLNPPLRIASVDHRWVLHCFNGCQVDDVLTAAGLGWRDLYPPDRRPSPEVNSCNSLIRTPYLPEAAYYGFTGEFLQAVEPHTEAPSAAILAHILAMFGTVCGDTCTINIGTRQPPRVNALLVGDTSEGRKGTAEGVARELFAMAFPSWTKEQVVSGLSSGEGLIARVADKVSRDKDGNEELEVVDKRLCVIEPEFSRVLAQTKREGNVLSAIIRQAFDSGNLEVMTRSDPLSATDAHISIVGHITKAELTRRLTATEMANGFVNRFLIFQVGRTKILPFGGFLPEEELKPFAKWLHDAATAFSGREMTFRDDARELWKATYVTLTQSQPGLVGAIIARRSTLVLRVALIYALLDKSKWITRDHLEAAIAVWMYCEESARTIFAEATGDSLADRVLTKIAMEENGLTQTQISNALGRNYDSKRIKQALDLLYTQRLATYETVSTKGRSAKVWRVTRNEVTKNTN